MAPGAVVLAVWISSVAAVFSPAAAFAQERAGTRLNYVNAPLPDVIRSLSAALGLNVVVTDVPDTRITLTTPSAVPRAELGAVLESVLESNGLMLVQTGPIAQLLPVAKAPTTGAVHFGRELPTPPPVGLITQIVPLEFIRADEAVALLKQIAGPTARIETVPRSNSILITDRSSKIARYLELLRGVDVKTDGEAGLRTYVVELKHASAVDLAATLSQLFGVVAAQAPAAPAEEEPLEERGLSRTLDQFRERELEALEQRREQPVPALPAPPPADTAAQAEEVRGLVGETTVVPNPATNALVIRTAPPNFPVLKETIDALDVRPPQVLLEVLIAEIALDRSTEFGIDWSVLARKNIDGRPADIAGSFGPQLSDSALAGLSDFVFRIVRLGSVSVRAVLRALATSSDVRVLSTPHILALNNEEARILVGNEVPFSQSTRTGLDVVVDRIVQFRDVGTQLTIKPTVNTDGYVTFRILQEASTLTAQTIAAALDAPIITVREAETSAIVKDGQTIVIGGLIDEQRTVNESGVPVLKDIPIAGNLFKRRSTSRFRTELAIFVTPHIVYTDEDAERLRQRQQRRLEQDTRRDVDRQLQRPPKPRKP